jgi:adenylate cyclase
MVEVLFKHNGTLDKYVGDEVMALFGVPISYLDSTLSAVQCALEMQRALAEFNRTRAADHMPAVNVGIGINTGEVVYGAIGASKALQYTVIGDAVNTAARLCSLAKAGEIICSEGTMLQVHDRVEAVPLPKTRVKGKQEELSIYRLTGIRGEPSAWHRDRTNPG